MFIEKLSDAQCNEIFSQILTTAFHNETMARFYMQSSRLLRYDNQLIKLQFFDVSEKKGQRYKDVAHFNDYSAEVGIGKAMNPVMVNKTFRRAMFRAFGQDYAKHYDELFRGYITTRYFRDLHNHNQVMEDMQRSDEENSIEK